MKKGDIVKDIIWGYEGEIMKEYENYWSILEDEDTYLTRTPDSWLQEQILPFTKKQVNNEKWFSIACHNGGSIWACESRLEIIF